MAAVVDVVTDAAQRIVDVRILRRFAGTVSVFGVFYLLLTHLVFRWDQYLGPAYSRYAGIFVVDWYILTATVVLFVMIVGLAGPRTRLAFKRRTAVVLTVPDAVASILALVVIALVLVLAYYAMGASFPMDLGTILFLMPVLSIAAFTETLAYQWFLARTFNTYWRRGYVWAAVVFAAAHAHLTVATFAVLIILGLFFYYLTNPSGNLPFFFNVVLAAGVHVLYNVFVFAYGGPQGLLISQAVGFTGPTLALWVLLGAIAAVLLWGEARSRLKKVVDVLTA